jgi:NADPH-dependent 2,4-dienoyl-CoA reductase/sulfur reductase-like enzyme/nitrite reductase/ring-hydroxylating ferredoxin subunit
MGTDTSTPSGPDLEVGVAESELHDDVPFIGRTSAGDAVLFVKTGGTIHAVAASCTHYGGSLAEGVVEGGRIHCPLHHACFELRNGRAAAPALNDLACWDVVREGGLVRLGAKRAPASRGVPSRMPSSIVIVGAGAAGAACAEMLRTEGYDGTITMIGDEAPVDRPNVSKDFLAGSAPDEWMPLRPLDFYRDARIDYVAEAVTAIDVATHEVITARGSIGYGALLLATGAEPFVLPIEGARLPHVHTLRTLADAQALIAANAKRVVVIGTGFIGLEVAASLRARGCDVHVVGMDAVPLERVIGPALGQHVRALHESHGVAFHLGRKPARIDETFVTLDDGTKLDADVVVMGTGVRPRVALAQDAGLTIENGIVVDDRLRTSAPDVFAAGDVARLPYRGALVRIEHWAYAERQGQHVARAMLGRDVPFDDVPFFWSAHYDVTIRYVGHTERWSSVRVEGSIEAHDVALRFEENGRVAAVATIGRDREALRASLALRA